MTNIVTITANDYCHSVFDGTHATPKPCPNGYKLVTSKNITSDGINISDAYFISEQDYFEINKRSKVCQWDILFSMIGTVGNLYLEENSNINYAINSVTSIVSKGLNIAIVINIIIILVLFFATTYILDKKLNLE